VQRGAIVSDADRPMSAYENSPWWPMTPSTFPLVEHKSWVAAHHPLLAIKNRIPVSPLTHVAYAKLNKI
jgi:hypothetical protein